MKQCFFVLNLQKRNYFVLIAPYCGKNPTKFSFSSSSRTFVFRSTLYTFVLLDKEVNIHRQCGDIRNNKKSRFMYSTHSKPTLYKMSFVCETILKTSDVKVRRPWDRLTPIEQLTAFSKLSPRQLASTPSGEDVCTFRYLQR